MIQETPGYPKVWYKSKTLWIAIAQAAVGILLVIIQQHPEIGGLMIAKSVVDAIIRLLTTDPITTTSN